MLSFSAFLYGHVHSLASFMPSPTMVPFLFFYLNFFILHILYFCSTSSFTYYPNHLTYSTHIAVSPEQASMLVHHPSTPVSLGLSCPKLGLSYPTSLGFCPHQGLSCPSRLGFYHPTQSSNLDFVLPQQVP